MKNKKKYKKPNWFIYKIFYIASKIVSKIKLNLKVLRNETKNKKGSFVVIGNHAAALDFIPACVALKRRVNFVVSNAFYQTLPVRPLLEKVRVIPKNQFQTSISDMRKMREVIDNDMPLVIYPAGLMTENGVGTPIPPSTGKALKWFAKDVYVAKVKGTYLTTPKWSKLWRKGETTIDVYKLFDAEELKDLTDEQIQKRIEEELYFDEYQEQKENPIAFKNGDNIQGLENVLYVCPHCGEQFSFSATCYNELTCNKCGYSVKANKYGLFEQNGDKPLIYDSVSEWSKAIEKESEKEMSKEDFYLTSLAQLQVLNVKKHKFETKGECSITLNKTQIVLTSEEINKTFITKLYPTLPFKPGKCFDLQDGNDIYRIVLQDGKQVIKWINAVKYFYKEQNK